MKCFALDSDVPYTLVMVHERSSAERPAGATQSSVCHGSLSSAVPPVIEHAQSSAERPASSEPSGALIDKILLAPLSLKAATPLRDQFLEDLEEGSDGGSHLLEHIQRFCFFGDLCFVNPSGDHLERPMPLSVKMEDLLKVVLAKRRGSLQRKALAKKSWPTIRPFLLR